jgi:hypothetical protein
MRYWRSIWLSLVMRVFVAFPVFLAVAIPYYTAIAIVAAVDKLAGILGSFNIACLNMDRERARQKGWQPYRAPKAPAPSLSPEWLSKIDREQ